MKIINRNNYLSLVDNTFPSFASEGWADGYADLENNSNEIIRQLYGKVSKEKLLECVIDYLSGYGVGCDFSENIEDVYDEEGIIKPGWEKAGPCISDYENYEEDAKLLLRKYIESLNK